MGEVKAALREQAYDLVFDIQGNLKSGLIGWLSGGHDRLGFTAENLQERINFLFTTRQVPVRSQDYHITDQYLRVVSVPFGKISGTWTFRPISVRLRKTMPLPKRSLATLGNGLAFPVPLRDHVAD